MSTGPPHLRFPEVSVELLPEDCAVCLEEFKPGEWVCTLSCHPTHTFHWKCVRDCSMPCPLCRSTQWELQHQIVKA